MAKRRKPTPDQDGSLRQKKTFVVSPLALQRLSGAIGKNLHKVLPPEARDTRDPDWRWIPDTITNRNQLAFLIAYGETGNQRLSSRLANVSRTAHHRWMREDKEYARAFALAEQQSLLALEEAVYRRAVIGVDAPVYQGGECVGTVRKFSDTLLMFALRGKDPTKYGDNRRIEHTGPDGGPIQIAAVRANVETILQDKAAADLASQLYERMALPATSVDAKVIEAEPATTAGNGRRNGKRNGTTHKPK